MRLYIQQQPLHQWLLASLLLSSNVVTLTQASSPLDASHRFACAVFQKSPDLSKCPPNTVYVSATDSKAKYRTIQKAVESLQANGGRDPATILIGKGTYEEAVKIHRSGPVTILGQLTSSSTPSVKNNLVTITRHRCLASSSEDNLATAALLIDSCTDAKLYNIKVVQTCTVGVSLAFAAVQSKVGAYSCEFAGRQDTFFTGPGANVYVSGSIIRGSVDYFYGVGRAWIERSVFANRGALGVSVAWKGSYESGSQAIISNSRVELSKDTSVKPKGTFALARSWDSKANAIFLNCFMDSTVMLTGFSEWKPSEPRLGSSTFFAEYQSSGPGFVSSGRKLVTSGSVDKNHLSHVLNQKAASQYSPGKTFAAVGTNWIDRTHKEVASQ